MAITTTALVKAQFSIPDTRDDVWLATVIDAVGDAMEAVTGRYLWKRSAVTSYFDGSPDPYTLAVPIGISTISYLGVAWADQPDDGTGIYTSVPLAWVYLDPPAQLRNPGWPATAITVSPRSGISLPTGGKRLVKATGDWGPQSVAPRVGQIALAAVGRAWLTRRNGGADYAVAGPDGGMKLLRDLAPAELEELYSTFGVAGGYA